MLNMALPAPDQGFQALCDKARSHVVARPGEFFLLLSFLRLGLVLVCFSFF